VIGAIGPDLIGLWSFAARRKMRARLGGGSEAETPPTPSLDLRREPVEILSSVLFEGSLGELVQAYLEIAPHGREAAGSRLVALP
jgi:hypothetical protein